MLHGHDSFLVLFEVLNYINNNINNGEENLCRNGNSEFIQAKQIAMLNSEIP